MKKLIATILLALSASLGAQNLSSGDEISMTPLLEAEYALLRSPPQVQFEVYKAMLPDLNYKGFPTRQAKVILNLSHSDKFFDFHTWLLGPPSCQGGALNSGKRVRTEETTTGH